ncbi:hypothetical protein BLNAU_5066 [Blattamonas nauphoetae]|uniref:Polynucleotide adenylyltransferase n=1 Tax=Blattamonas nauphoetae TaxID=2049346 RepID=A0ABQ9Y866_9EUKA|nr:hypothetical protein BLNAU_5066 [Blattamonas nauphoetae]
MINRENFATKRSPHELNTPPTFNSSATSSTHIIKSASGMTTLKFTNRKRTNPFLPTSTGSSPLHSGDKPPIPVNITTHQTVRPILVQNKQSPSIKPVKICSPSLNLAMQRSNSLTPKLPPSSPFMPDVTDTILPSFSSLTSQPISRENSRSPSHYINERVFTIPDALFHSTSSFPTEFSELAIHSTEPDWLIASSHAPYMESLGYQDLSVQRNMLSSPAFGSFKSNPSPNPRPQQNSLSEDLNQLTLLMGMTQCEAFGKLRLVSKIRKVLATTILKQFPFTQTADAANASVFSKPERAVAEKLSRFKLHFYGSFSILATSLPQSDIDICIVTEEQQRCLTRIQHYLRIVVDGWMKNTKEVRSTQHSSSFSLAVPLTDTPAVNDPTPTSPADPSEKVSIQTIRDLLQKASDTSDTSILLLESLFSALQLSGMFTETKIVSKTKYPVIKVQDQFYCLHADDETNSVSSAFSSQSNDIMYPLTTSVNTTSSTDLQDPTATSDIYLISPSSSPPLGTYPVPSLHSVPPIPSCNSPLSDYGQFLSSDSVFPHADISAGSINGIVNSDLLRELFCYYPPAPKLIFLVKWILCKHHLNEPYTGGLGGYSLSLLVLSHLQMFKRNFGKDWRSTPFFELFLSFLELYGESNTLPIVPSQTRYSSSSHKISVQFGGEYHEWTRDQKDEAAQTNPLSQEWLYIEDPILENVNTAHNCSLFPQIQHLFLDCFNTILELYPEIQRPVNGNSLSHHSPTLTHSLSPAPHHLLAQSPTHNLLSVSPFTPRGLHTQQTRNPDQPTKPCLSSSRSDSELFPSLVTSSPRPGPSIVLPVFTAACQATVLQSPAKAYSQQNYSIYQAPRQCPRISQLGSVLGFTQNIAQGRSRYNSYSASCRQRLRVEPN